MGYPYGAVGGWFQMVSTACRMPLGSSVVLDAVAVSGISRTDQSVSVVRQQQGGDRGQMAQDGARRGSRRLDDATR
jgi:hypothetical protein